MPLTYTPDPKLGLRFMVDFDRFDCEDFYGGHGRWQYTCTIDFEGEILDAGVIRSGTTTRDNPEGLGAMLGSFLTFFSAWIQSPGAHVGLFPESCNPVRELLDSGQVALWADEVTRTVI